MALIWRSVHVTSLLQACLPMAIATFHAHVTIHIYTYIYIHIHTYIYIHTYIHIHTYIYMHTYIQIHTYIHTHTKCMYIYLNASQISTLVKLICIHTYIRHVNTQIYNDNYTASWYVFEQHTVHLLYVHNITEPQWHDKLTNISLKVWATLVISREPPCTCDRSLFTRYNIRTTRRSKSQAA